MRFVAFLSLAVFLTGCGYMGEPLPPALRRPIPVTDLTAVEHGSTITIQFTVPKLTTENLPVIDPDLELRVGPSGSPVEPFGWIATSDKITNVTIEKGIAKAEVPIGRYDGKQVAVGVNVHGPNGRSVGWSNFVVLNIVPALNPPTSLDAKDGPDSIVLSWQGAAPEFRIFRKTVASPDWVRIGVSPTATYADSTIEYGETYQYYVQGQAKAGELYAESEGSDVKTFKPVDKFPPAVPSGLTAVPGARSVELVWDRNLEKDFAGYRIYKDGKALPQTIVSAAYSDRDVQPGSKHEYRVTAIDTVGNESAQSPPVTVEIP
jgi:hypothetical protein